MSTRTRSSTRIQALQSVAAEISETESNHTEDSSGGRSHSTLEEKEREIWDEVRDEHYEVIEQLPLTIHRQLALLRQLDGQSLGYSNNLLPAIRQYIELRRSLVTNNVHAAEAVPNPLPQEGSPNGATPTGSISNRAPSILSATGIQGNAKTLTTSREMLSHIAWLSEEYLRTSHEKVNLAQTTHDSVDRHIRLLDQFIKEQEASLGPDPNVPMMLSMSELVVPKWSRSMRVSMSPILDEEEEQTASPNPLNIPSNPETLLPSNKRRPPGNRRRKEKEKEDQNAAAALKITVPVQLQEAYALRLPVDPNEPTWCYCNRVSFGEMIGCDDPECKYEWFHLECAGLKEVPDDDEWYCRECTLRRESKSRRR